MKPSPTVQTISSVQNPRIKEVLKLNKRTYRSDRKLTIAEGGREIGMALASDVIPVRVFICPPLLDETSAQIAHACRELAEPRAIELSEVTPEVYAKIAYRSTTGGLLAIIPQRSLSLEELSPTLSPEPLLLIVEGVEKPGNLGALLRTADAAGVDAVIACGDGTDIYNPNTIRASLGALFTLPVVQANSAETLAWLRMKRIKTIAASPFAKTAYWNHSMTGALAMVLGSEAFGLSQLWLEAADELIQIPMSGKVDSLNLSASAAILLYEAVRQRR